MTMGLITKVNIELIKAAIDFNISRKEVDEEVPEGLSAIVNALSLLDTTALNSLVNVISIGFIMFLVVNVIAMMMIKKVKDFANKFSSGCLPDIGAKAGGIVASASVGAAKKLAAPGALRTGMKEGFKDGTSGVRRFVKGKAKKFKNKIGDKLLGSTEFDKRLLAIRYQRKENEGKPDAAVLAQNQQSIDDIFTK